MRIKVPKTPKSAFDPTRKPNQLIRAHVAHAEAAAKIPKKKRRSHTIRTEGGAAKYLARLMSKLHPHNVEKA